MSNSKNNAEMHKKTTVIVINGREIEVLEKKLTFEEIVRMALGSYNPNESTIYTVSFSKNEHDKGLLVAGDIISVRKGLIFNVTQTSRS